MENESRHVEQEGIEADYEIVPDEVEKECEAANGANDGTDGVDDLNPPVGMQWITHVAEPVDFRTSGKHGRYIVSIHPPLVDHIAMCLAAYAGQSIYQMLANGLVSTITVNETFMATVLGHRIDLLTTTGDLFAKYMSLMALYSSCASAPTEKEAECYERTNTFHEESTAVYTAMTSFLVHGCLNKCEFKDDEHMKLPTPPAIRCNQMQDVLIGAAEMGKRPDGAQASVVVTQFLLNRLMTHIRSGGRDLIDWFTERRLKRDPFAVVEVDPEDLLPQHKKVDEPGIPFIQGQVRVQARFRRTPAWFRAFCTRRSWFFPSMLPGWFSDMWLMRVTTRIVMYEQIAFMRKFLATRRKSGMNVLNMAKEEISLSDEKCGDLGREVQAAYQATRSLAWRMNDFAAELLSPARCKGDVIGQSEFAFIPNSFEEDGKTIECVVGPSAVEEVEGRKVYVDDGKMHIPQDVYNRFKAESDFMSGATTSMIHRLCSILGYSEQKEKAMIRCLDDAIPDADNAFYLYGPPIRDIVRLLLCVGLQNEVDCKIAEFYDLDVSRSDGAADPMKICQAMYVANSAMIQEMVSKSQQLMIGVYAETNPTIKARMANKIKPSEEGDKNEN